MHAKILAAATAVLVVVALLYCPVADALSAEDTADDDMEEYVYVRWHEEYGEYDIYLTYSVGYWACIWSPGYDTWTYCFKAASVASSDGGGWSVYDDGVIGSASFHVEFLENGDSGYLSMIDDEKFVWSTPSSSKSGNTEFVSSLLMNVAMSAVGGMGAALSWATVSSLIGCLGNASNYSTVDSQQIWHAWEWGTNISECAQHMMFRLDVEPGESVTIAVQYMLYGPGYETVQPYRTAFEATAPAADSSSLEAMSDEELEAAGIERITLEELERYAAEGLVSEEAVEEALECGEKTFYIATGTVCAYQDDGTARVGKRASHGSGNIKVSIETA